MNKSVLITGASSGLGKDFAILYAEKGYDLVLTARRESNLRSIASDLTSKYNISVAIIPADLGEPQSPYKIFNFCEESNIKIDILINNAGYGLTGEFDKISWEEHDTFILSLIHI